MKTFWGCLPVLFAMIVGHLCSPVVRADEIGTTSKIVRRETGLTSGISVTTYADGHVLTITPGAASTPDMDTFWGEPIARITPNSVGQYEQSQNAILDRARAYNESVARINAMNRARSSGRNGYGGGGGRSPRIGPTNNTHITIKGK
jgi:hypothetical protein